MQIFFSSEKKNNLVIAIIINILGENVQLTGGKN